MHSYHDQPRPPWSRGWGHPPTGGGQIPTPAPGTMRVSDAERTEVTNALCRHYGDGRLDEAEFNDRLAMATAAKTRDDLAPLLADLPRLDVAMPEVPPRRPRRRLTWVLGVLAVIAVTSMLSGVVVHGFMHPHVPWVVVAVVVFVLLRRQRYHRRSRDRV